MLNFTSEVHCRARRLDANARVRFPERFTFRAAVNCGASRADLEPRFGSSTRNGTLDVYRPNTGTQLHHL